MESNIKPVKIEEIRKESVEIKPTNKSEFIRIDSPSADNELVKFKFNSLQRKNSGNTEKERITPSHDKEIKEDSIIYFTKKLKKINVEYHKYLYISIFIFFMDIIIWYFDKQLFHERYNLYSLIIILLVTLIQICAFRHKFDSITKKIYVTTRRIIYLYFISIIIYITNLSFITYFGIIYHYGKKNHIFKYPMFNLNFFNFSLIIFFYILVNLFIPIMVLIKLIEIKRNIKKISSAKGEIYETVKINDSQINSIIN